MQYSILRIKKEIASIYNIELIIHQFIFCTPELYVFQYISEFNLD